MKGSNVLKVRIYNLQSRTVFSTDPAQIGQDKSANPGFGKAPSGISANQLMIRDSFDAFEGTLVEGNVVSSYVAVMATDGYRVDGVVETYSDATDLVSSMEHTQWKILLSVPASLSALYLVLYAVVSRANRAIEAQEQERLANEARIHHQAYHDALTAEPAKFQRKTARAPRYAANPMSRSLQPLRC
jgi:hypothetical protein